MRKKVTVVGAGNVGSTCAQRIFEKAYADIVLVDIIEGLPQGKALDIQQSGALVGSDSHIVGTNGYEETTNSDIAIITSGVPRKAGMSRDDLLLTNKEIITGVVQNVVKFSPNCIIIVVTNPLDALAQLALHVSGLSRNRVMGQSGVLDTARFVSFVAAELGVSVQDIQACVLGGHGDTMVPIPRLTMVAGAPLTELVSAAVVDRIVERTVKGGAEIVALIKGSSAYYAPSAAVVEMVDSIVMDRKHVLPCSVYLQGEYGIDGVFVSVPVKLGADGVEQVVELKLTSEELAALKKSAQAVKELVDVMRVGAKR